MKKNDPWVLLRQNNPITLKLGGHYSMLKNDPRSLLYEDHYSSLHRNKTFVISRHDIDDTVVKNLKSIAKNENWILNKGSNDIDDNGKCLL